MRDTRVSIRFFDEQGAYASRYWSHVPRVGDEIMLDAGRRYKPYADGNAVFKVARVIWGVEWPSDPTQRVNIEISPISPLRGEAE